MTSFDRLHPAVQYHIVNSLGWSSLRPTQLEAIDPIQAGTHCLLLAPTAGGKTEAALMPVLSRMLLESWTGLSVLYICPIKALLNNLEIRLSHYAGLVGRRVEVWHGDVSDSRKRKVLSDPPDILLTTPESLEGMLISTRVEREAWFGNLRTAILDELHAFAVDDRGWHLRAVLTRLERYAARPVQRIGLSATVSNPEELLAWLAPTGPRAVVGSSHVSTDADVTIDYVGSLENAAIVIDRLHRGSKRLVFCDSRSSTERLSNMLMEKGIRTFVSHASLSAAERKQAEVAFATERDCVIVATSTLELGIDVGGLDYVIQIDAPSTVSSFLQRMGRTGRRTGARRNCLFLATNEHAFMLTLGIAELWSRGWVEAAMPPPEPWGVVAQQALTSALELGQVPLRELHALLTTAFTELAREDIHALLEHLLAQGYLSALDDGVIQIGPTAEREFGRAHYRDLLATFTGSELLTAKYGSADVGFIDPTVLSAKDELQCVLLAGRSWHVTGIDWRKRTVWLEPTKGRGKARWIGGSRSVAREICEATRGVILEGETMHATLSRRARAQLEKAQNEVPAAREGSTIVHSESNRMRIWTFAGTRANRTYARALGASLRVIAFDEFGIDCRGVVGHAMELRATPRTPLDLYEIKTYRSAVKFSDCLSDDLLSRLIDSRYFSLTVEQGT